MSMNTTGYIPPAAGGYASVALPREALASVRHGASSPRVRPGLLHGLTLVIFRAGRGDAGPGLAAAAAASCPSSPFTTA